MSIKVVNKIAKKMEKTVKSYLHFSKKHEEKGRKGEKPNPPDRKKQEQQSVTNKKGGLPPLSRKKKMEDCIDRLWKSYRDYVLLEKDYDTMQSIIYRGGIIQNTKELITRMEADLDEDKKARKIVNLCANTLYNTIMKYVERDGENWKYREAKEVPMTIESILLNMGIDKSFCSEKNIQKIENEERALRNKAELLKNSDGFTLCNSLFSRLITVAMDFALMAESDDMPDTKEVLEKANALIDEVKKCVNF